MKWWSLSRVWLFATPWTIQSVEFSRPEYWSRLPFPSPGDLPNPGTELTSPASAGRFFTTEPPGKQLYSNDFSRKWSLWPWSLGSLRAWPGVGVEITRPGFSLSNFWLWLPSCASLPWKGWRLTAPSTILQFLSTQGRRTVFLAAAKYQISEKTSYPAGVTCPSLTSSFGGHVIQPVSSTPKSLSPSLSLCISLRPEPQDYF